MKDLSAKQPETSAAKPEKFVIFTGSCWLVGVSHAVIDSGLNAFLDPSWPQATEAISPRLESIDTLTQSWKSGLTQVLASGLLAPLQSRVSPELYPEINTGLKGAGVKLG